MLAEEERRLAELNSRQKKANLGAGFNTFRAKTSTVSALSWHHENMVS